SRRGIVMLLLAASLVAKLTAALPPWFWLVPAVFGGLFIGLVVKHAGVASERMLLEERADYVKAGLERMGAIPAVTPPAKPSALVPAETYGARFARPEHPNACDLDLFGERSLFKSLSRAQTAVGEETIAKWVLEPAPVERIHARQEAAKELLETPLLLEDLAILARRAESRGRSEEPLTAWGEAPAELPVFGVDPKDRASGEQPRLALVRLAMVLVPLTIALFFARNLLAETHRFLGYLYLAPFLAQVAVLGALRGPIDRMVTIVSSRESPFGRFRQVFARIEACELRAEPLAHAVETLRGDPPASREIANLERVIGFADLRHNAIIHIVLNLVFLYDVWVALALERWRSRAGRKARRWLAAVGEMEAYASIATYAGEHPQFCWPEVSEGPARLTAEGLGHPLIIGSERVTNDVDLPEPGRALLITGSNMSGKSTYLRSLGLLAVMANAGLPVCATRASLTPLTAWTSMRISDDLGGGMSHFYAELVRLRAIVDAARAGHTVLFLLDEILHGTNSRERTIGARGVVHDLVRGGAIGGVSTHDFALVAIAEESDGKVRTVHFSDRIEGGKMVFDYKLKPGVVQSTNAIRLMKAVGIDVEYGV
ncbi:MAG: DNA mismatch repair protein MutS, partial [Myxococcales bacterium]|nr:DNA mismatch repair protein MutS [Myxococcales bacterium]